MQIDLCIGLIHNNIYICRQHEIVEERKQTKMKIINRYDDNIHIYIPRYNTKKKKNTSIYVT